MASSGHKCTTLWLVTLILNAKICTCWTLLDNHKQKRIPAVEFHNNCSWNELNFLLLQYEKMTKSYRTILLDSYWSITWTSFMYQETVQSLKGSDRDHLPNLERLNRFFLLSYVYDYCVSGPPPWVILCPCPNG